LGAALGFDLALRCWAPSRILSCTLKLIAEPWDIGQGGYQIGAFPANWGEWNDRFRDSVQRFWQGDPQPGELQQELPDPPTCSADTTTHRVA
jgi:glycogen operon protein